MPRPNAPRLVERYRALRLWRWPARSKPYELVTVGGAHRGWFRLFKEGERAMGARR